MLISCNRNRASYQAYVKTTVTDQRADYQGPLAGLEAATAHVEPGYLAVTSCDVPLLPGDLVSRLCTALAHGANAAQVAYAHDGERAQYLCAVIDTRCLDTLREFLDSGQRAVHAWYASCGAVAVDFSDRPDCFTNVNHSD